MTYRDAINKLGIYIDSQQRARLDEKLSPDDLESLKTIKDGLETRSKSSYKKLDDKIYYGLARLIKKDVYNSGTVKSMVTALNKWEEKASKNRRTWNEKKIEREILESNENKNVQKGNREGRKSSTKVKIKGKNNNAVIVYGNYINHISQFASTSSISNSSTPSSAAQSDVALECEQETETCRYGNSENIETAKVNVNVKKGISIAITIVSALLVIIVVILQFCIPDSKYYKQALIIVFSALSSLGGLVTPLPIAINPKHKEVEIPNHIKILGLGVAFFASVIFFILTALFRLKIYHIFVFIITAIILIISIVLIVDNNKKCVTKKSNTIKILLTVCIMLFSVAFSITDAIDMGSGLDKVSFKDATCIESGNEEYWKSPVFIGICYENEDSIYSVRKSKFYIAPKGHDLVTQPGQPATCIEAGWEEYKKCSRCDYSEQIIISADPSNHDLSHVDAVSPTCTEGGNIEYWQCDACHKCFTDSNGKNEILQESTKLNATGHLYNAVLLPGAWNDWTDENSIAYFTFTCSACYEEQIVRAEVSIVQNVDPTCESDGVKVCLATVRYNGQEIDNDRKVIDKQKLGHNFSEEITTVVATCTQDGSRYKPCLRPGCNAKKDEITISALGHNFSEEITTVAATCTQDGSRYKPCLRSGCNAKKDEITISALGHDYHEEIISPTTINDGYTRHKCSRCVHYYDDKIVPAYLSFELNEDDLSYKVSGCNITSSMDIEIPDTYRNKPVTLISADAFRNNLYLTGIIIPNSVTYIAKGSLRGCTNLHSVTIPFVGETKDGAENTHFGYIFGSDGSIDSNTSNYVPISLKEVIITGGTKIESAAFAGCRGIAKVVLADSIESIGGAAFRCCTNLVSITLGKNLTSIAEISETPSFFITGAAFDFCYRLVEIYNRSSLDIKKGANNFGLVGLFAKNIYKSEGGSCLSDTNDGYIVYQDGIKQIIVSYLGNEPNISIPDNICGINDYAFYDCDMLTNVVIPNSVVTIGDNAFNHCSALTDISIGNGVKSISGGTFMSCDKLTNVVLNFGLETIGQSAFNGCTSLKVIAMPDSLTFIDQFAFCESGLESVTIPKHVEIIGYRAFYGCEELKNLTIILNPETTTEINAEAFAAGIGTVNKLETINFIDDGPLTIGQRAFAETSIITLSMHSRDDSIIYGKYIEEGAFRYCSNLRCINLGYGVYSIGDSAFYGCLNLCEISITEDVYYIGRDAFGATEWYESQPNGLIYLGKIAYKYKGKMPTNTTITIIDGTEAITEYAFYDCKGLISIILPQSVTLIGKLAFKGCSNLKNARFMKPNYALMPTWKVYDQDDNNTAEDVLISWIDLQNELLAAKYLVESYADYFWDRGY